MKKSLAKQFSILFLLFALVTTIFSGVVSYINQTRSYHRECIESLEQITSHIAGLLQKEGSEFADIMSWISEHDYQPYIPLNFRDNLPYDKQQYIKYIQDNYDDIPAYEDMDEEAKRLYVRCRYEYWLTVFLDAMEEFGVEYVYFIMPVADEEYTVRYMIDATLWTIEAEDGSEVLLIGDKVPEDPKYHKYMWEAWESGKETRNIDSLNNEFGYNYTYCYPLHIEGEKLGMVCADINVHRVNSEILNSVIRQVLTSAAVLFLATIVLYHFLLKRILLRIAGLKKNVEEYSQTKNPDVAKTIRESKGQEDELGLLSDEFSEMITELEDYMINLQKVTKEKERIGAELSVATQIQADMLPRVFPAFPTRPEFDIYATMNPAKEVGGDFYDFFLVDEKHLAVVIADVSGKGVPAALFMVIAKTLIKNRMQMGEEPAKALMNVNEQLCEGNDAELFVTVWLALIDIETGHVIEANAGHEYPALKRRGGEFELIKTKHSPAVATIEGIRFKQAEFDLNPGDFIYVYTDGVTEATNSNEELFGEERLTRALNNNKEALPGELLPAVRRDIDEFVAEAPQFDDITMLGFLYYGKDGAEGLK
jgi:sigma-B regulation protein RsbU (phosphoserine phosphatase)